MNNIRNFRQWLQNFLHNKEGAVLPIIGLAFLVLVGSVGMAIDTGKGQMVQSKLSAALDAAGLAAGANMSTSANIQADVDKYFYANYPTGYMGSTITSLIATPNEAGTLITLTATARVPTSFMQLFGQPNMTVGASSEVTRTSKGLELVMVLDNTISMQYDIDDLQDAAKDLLDILYGTQSEISNLYVGVVPFAQTVNIGSSHTDWVNSDTYNWGPSSWGGCVDARLNGKDITDDPPDSVANKFVRYYWPDDSNNNWISTSSGYWSCCWRWNAGGTTYDITGANKGPNKYCSSEVLRMTRSKEDVIDAIDDMYVTGYTHVNLGAVWGWRMLSPRWRGYWGGTMATYSLPLDYNTPLMSKAIVIMTDGENTVSDSVRTAYWYPDDGRLGHVGEYNEHAKQADELDDKLEAVCDAMTTENIIVYTIAFGNPGSSIEGLLEDCASQPEFYFDSPTTSALNTAFRTIGDSLANLRVSK